jgi:hypothetical protein
MMPKNMPNEPTKTLAFHRRRGRLRGLNHTGGNEPLDMYCREERGCSASTPREVTRSIRPIGANDWFHASPPNAEAPALRDEKRH